MQIVINILFIAQLFLKVTTHESFKIVKNGNKSLKAGVDSDQFKISFKEFSRTLTKNFLDIMVQM